MKCEYINTNIPFKYLHFVNVLLDGTSQKACQKSHHKHISFKIYNTHTHTHTHIFLGISEWLHENFLFQRIILF